MLTGVGCRMQSYTKSFLWSYEAQHKQKQHQPIRLIALRKWPRVLCRMPFQILIAGFHVASTCRVFTHPRGSPVVRTLTYIVIANSVHWTLSNLVNLYTCVQFTALHYNIKLRTYIDLFCIALTRGERKCRRCRHICVIFRHASVSSTYPGTSVRG